MPDSENIDINATDFNQPNKTQDSNDNSNNIHVNVMDLSDVSVPGETNDDFLDKILSIPAEKLIKWENCSLPSRGIYYGWPDGTVLVKPMGQTAEKILATQRLAQDGQSIDYLFRECCQFPPGFDSSELLLGDKVFLLFYIRGITHGELYEFAMTCTNESCAQISTHSYNLNELASTITWANPSLGTEPFKIVLPMMSSSFKKEVYVGVRFLRSYDGNDMLAKRKAKKKMMVRPGSSVRTRRMQGQGPDRSQNNHALDETISDNMEKIIVNVMGNTDLFKIRAFISKLHAQDTATIREWLRNNTPGIDSTITVTCPECSHEYTVELPVTESFFRPSKSGRTG